MAQYSEDWSGSTLGAAPTGWTRRYGTPDILTVVEKTGTVSGRVMRMASHSTANVLYGASMDAVDADADRADFEIFCVYSITANISNTPVNVAGRMTGTARTDAYFIATTTTNVATASGKRIAKRVNGTPTTVASSSYTNVVDRRIAALLRVSGTSVQAKIWEYEVESEPGTWTYTGTVTDVSGFGWAGVFEGSISTTSGQGPVDYEYFSVGTGTDSAPRPTSDPAEISFSGSVPAQSWVEDSAITPLDLSTYFAGDLTPFSYAVTTGTLPAGLSLNSSTGVISGTPTTPASAASIVVTATDDESNTAATNAFNIAITDFVEAVRGVQVVLHDRATQSPRASVTGITARWWDSPTESGAPLLKTDTASTDAAGLLELDIESVTSLSLAGVGYLSIYKAGATPETDLHFASRLAVVDIA